MLNWPPLQNTHGSPDIEIFLGPTHYYSSTIEVVTETSQVQLYYGVPLWCFQCSRRCLIPPSQITLLNGYLIAIVWLCGSDTSSLYHRPPGIRHPQSIAPRPDQLTLISAPRWPSLLQFRHFCAFHVALAFPPSQGIPRLPLFRSLWLLAHLQAPHPQL